VIKIQQKAFAAVEEAQADDVIPLEAEEWKDHDAQEKREEVRARAALVDEDLSAERAVSIHVLNVGRERWVGVVEDIGIEGGGGAGEADALVYGTGFELWRDGEAAAEEAEFGVWVEAAVFDPATQEEVATLEEEGVDGGLRGQGLADLLLEFGGEFFVGVEREDPVAGALGEGKILLFGESGPWCDRWNRSRRGGFRRPMKRWLRCVRGSLLR
jgi:hypothetical protein